MNEDKSSDIEKVLFIAHHFPPMGGPGVYRSLQLVKNLPSNGYNPIVVTISLEDIKASGYPEDPTLLIEIENLNIIRVPTSEPKNLKRFLTRLRIFRLFWFFLYPLFWESSALWPFAAYKHCKRLIKNNEIKLIYTSSGPYSSLLLGFLLKFNLRVKWVADLRDPFSDAYAYVWPSKLHWYFSRSLERFVLRYADKVIVNTPEVEKLYLKRKLVKRDKITYVTNGY